MKISCLILTYNEAARITRALGHALKWADEVVVVDKWSTDGTAEISEQLGARVARIPFSRQGHESVEEIVSKATHDWVWLFTPGEVPTPACIAAGRALVSDAVDAIAVPMKYYSFGVHSPVSPWAGGYQPRLYHRRRVKFTGYCHGPITYERGAVIPSTPDCYVLHQTHATAQDFMRSHSDYMMQEAANGDPQQIIRQAFAHLAQWDEPLAADLALVGQALGWRIYWLGVALHAWERLQLSPIREAYATRAQQALNSWWP